MDNPGKQEKALDPIKIIAFIFVLILIVNMVLFAFGKITAFVFWFIIALCGLIAYLGLPKLRK